MWSDLPQAWQICFEEGWQAFKAGSLPIGAAIFDTAGDLVSRNCSQLHHKREGRKGLSGHALAHAEMNVLLEMFSRKSDPHKVTLYALLEPCPLCFGAIYMAGVRNVIYAARDAYAGSTNLLGKTEYLSLKPVMISFNNDAELELVVAALHAAAVLMRMPEKAEAVLGAQAKVTKNPVDFGRYLVNEPWLAKMMQTDAGPKSIYENLIYIYTEKFLKSKA